MTEATRSTERDNESFDIQDVVFRQSSPSDSPDIEGENSGSEPFISLRSVINHSDALDDAINEVRETSMVSSFPEQTLPNSDTEHSDDEILTRTNVPAWQQSYQCMHAHDGTEGQSNSNSKTIEILSKMQAHYERTMDEWRALSYRKAISALKKTKTYICTEEQAHA